MSNIKWGKTHKETLEIFIKDFTDELKSEIKTSILNDEYFLRLNQTQFHYALNKKYNIPAIGSTTVKYWTHRGWSIEEAVQKRKKNKMGNKSPMRIEHWVEKGLTPEEASFKIKSQRKLNKEYWIVRGYSDSESIKKVSEFQNENLKFAIDKCQKSRKNNPERFSMKLEYWLAKGYSEQEAQEKLKERQTTFSKEKLIKKYGEQKGLKKWLERQCKWQKSYKHSNFSKVSQELFKQIYSLIKDNYNEIYFAQLNENKEIDDSGKNHEYVLKLKNKSIKPDFFIKDSKKIIEFDGVYWHRKSSENKKREAIRDKDIINSGYSILHISEYDYHKNPEKEIQKCLEFIKN